LPRTRHLSGTESLLRMVSASRRRRARWPRHRPGAARPVPRRRRAPIRAQLNWPTPRSPGPPWLDSLKVSG